MPDNTFGKIIPTGIYMGNGRWIMYWRLFYIALRDTNRYTLKIVMRCLNMFVWCKEIAVRSETKAW